MRPFCRSLERLFEGAILGFATGWRKMSPKVVGIIPTPRSKKRDGAFSGLGSPSLFWRQATRWKAPCRLTFPARRVCASSSSVYVLFWCEASRILERQRVFEIRPLLGLPRLTDALVPAGKRERVRRGRADGLAGIDLSQEEEQFARLAQGFRWQRSPALPRASSRSRSASSCQTLRRLAGLRHPWGFGFRP